MGSGEGGVTVELGEGEVRTTFSDSGKANSAKNFHDSTSLWGEDGGFKGVSLSKETETQGEAASPR